MINASKFSIFFLDENQRVTLKDIGSESLIIKFAEELGAGIYTYELDSQFRCNGSDGYIAWLDNVLEIRETANFDIDGFDYEFKVFDDPNEMRNAIEEKNKINNKSRIVAGYCWEWPKDNRNNPNYNDIKIPEYNFEMSWNLDGGDIFALGEKTVKQAGCIHTTQGLEFDYVGVIIGNDMRYDGEHIVTDHKKRAGTDQSLKGLGTYKEEERNKIADEIIKNTYRTLMTKVMKRQLIKGTFDKDGWLNLGFCGHQPEIADRYVSTGSNYLCTFIFLPLGLQADDEFWTAKPEEWSSVKIWSGSRDIKKDGSIKN